MIRTVAKEKTINYPALFYCSGMFIVCAYIFGHSLIFDWYIPLFMLPITISLILFSLKYSENKILSTLSFILFVFSSISILITFYSAFHKPGYFVLFESGSRVKMYLTIGKIINEEYPNATLLTSEIGGLGYSFNKKVFDAAGLASTDALIFHPMRVPKDRSSGDLGAIPPEYVRFIDPDIIISYDIFAQAFLRSDVIAQYNVITLPAYLAEDAKYSKSKTIWGSEFIRIYIRKSFPVSNRICALAIISNETPNKACT
jgi:hypothetical protein